MCYKISPMSDLRPSKVQGSLNLSGHSTFRAKKGLETTSLVTVSYVLCWAKRLLFLV